MHGRVKALLIVVLCLAGCRDTSVRLLPTNGYEFRYADVQAMSRITEQTVDEVRRLLPDVPKNVILEVQNGDQVIPETGETATIRLPNVVVWIVDPDRPGGASEIIRTQLRATLFHELHHIVRDARVPRTTLMDHVVAEGLATAFERDGAGVDVPWGRYPDEVERWLDELRTLAPDAPRQSWMFRHSDGRRWIGFKVGTYLADRAMRRSGRSVAELATIPTAQILSARDD